MPGSADSELSSRRWPTRPDGSLPGPAFRAKAGIHKPAARAAQKWTPAVAPEKRWHATYKMVAMVLGTNIVRKELGLPEAECLAAPASR